MVNWYCEFNSLLKGKGVQKCLDGLDHIHSLSENDLGFAMDIISNLEKTTMRCLPFEFMPAFGVPLSKS